MVTDKQAREGYSQLPGCNSVRFSNSNILSEILTSLALASHSCAVCRGEVCVYLAYNETFLFLWGASQNQMLMLAG